MGKLGIFVALIVIGLGCMNVGALEISFDPQNALYLHDANPRRGTYDVIAHLITVRNNSNEKVTFDGAELQLIVGDKTFQAVQLDAGTFVKTTSQLNGMLQGEMKVMVDVLLPPEVLGKNGKLGSAPELGPGEVLVAQNVYMTVQKIPTVLRAVGRAKNPDGSAVEASAEIKIVQYKSPNRYIFPLKGAWYMQAVPNVTSHHRWMYQTEFGIDFFKVNERGIPFKTDGKSAADFYGFGEPVHAAADGVVVKAINDVVQNWDAWIRREGETEEQFYERSDQHQAEMMKKDLYRAVTGNLVILEHPGGEYSGYAHLKNGSVRVRSGDRVKQGQQIGEVGDTGDYYMAHLHFQISDRPDVIRGRSLPFSFVDLKPTLELGHFSRMKE